MIDELLFRGYECGDWIEKYDSAISGVQRKLRFEQGDWVVVVDSSGFTFKSGMSPSWVWEAYGEVGEVIGRYGGSAGLHCAIRVPMLKKVYPIHQWFLRRATREEIEVVKKEVQFNGLRKKFPELEGIF